MGQVGAGLVGMAVALFVEAYPSADTRADLDRGREELNARDRHELGMWAAGVRARQRPLRRLAIRRPYLYYLGIPAILLTGIALIIADVR